MLSALVIISLLCSAHATDTTTTVATTTTVDGTTTTVDSVDGTTTTDGATTTTGESTTSVGGTTTTVTGGSSTTVAAGATSQTTSGTCVDLIPETDVKNCAYLSYLCNDKNYIDLLTKNCPATCGRCGHTVAPTLAPAVCKDKMNPSTGTSDCNRLSYLCNDSVYHTLMTEQCPKTCNRCGGAAPSPSACVDKVNPSTGVSDCPATAHLCNNSAYYKLMTEQCPKTCGRC